MCVILGKKMSALCETFVIIFVFFQWKKILQLLFYFECNSILLKTPFTFMFSLYVILVREGFQEGERVIVDMCDSWKERSVLCETFVIIFVFFQWKKIQQFYFYFECNSIILKTPFTFMFSLYVMLYFLHKSFDYFIMLS